jgi:SAM-dependent methyltransferase
MLPLPTDHPNRLLVAIAALSALILFLEMLLVRWIGTELRAFAYLQNSVLVSAFLGLGLGCRNARRPVLLLPSMVALVAIACVIRDPLDWKIREAFTQSLVAFEDSVLWGVDSGLPKGLREARVVFVAFALGTTIAVLYAVALAFHPMGQWLGRWLEGHPRPIAPYSANILGSLIGIGAFQGNALLRTSPWVWLAITGAGLALLATRAEDDRPHRLVAGALALLLPLAGWVPGEHDTVWSPYQKLALLPLRAPSGTAGVGATCGGDIRVNNVGYQAMIEVDKKKWAAAPALYPPTEVPYSHYVLPHRLIGRRDRVLVVGSGAGNDVAAALEAGSRTVHAVEIDPAIVDLGRRHHPDSPYEAPNVRLAIDDARAFFRRDEGRYDLIWFGLLDSHTNPSAYTNVRLDHFVYTRESFADMKRMLAPSGVVVLLFEAQTWWIADRLVGLLREAFGGVPLAAWVRSSTLCLGGGGLMLIAGEPSAVERVRRSAEADPPLRARLLNPEGWQLVTTPTTDDWPYLYLQAPSLPRFHLIVGLACLMLGVLLRRRMFVPGEGSNLLMVLLGAGFMLLEVSGVSRAALLYGTTWTVNAYIVGAILAMTLLANLTASRVDVDLRLSFVGLLLSLLALAFLPSAWLAGLPLVPRVLVGGGFLALPVFFSGLVFVALWGAMPRKDLALGSNLFGALLGGVASMSSMLIGFRGLLLLTVAVYMGALLLVRRGAERAGAAQPG